MKEPKSKIGTFASTLKLDVERTGMYIITAENPAKAIELLRKISPLFIGRIVPYEVEMEFDEFLKSL